MATKQLCTITFIEDEDGVDVLVTSHPNGNDLEKLAKSVLEAVEALVKRHDPPNTPMDREQAVVKDSPWLTYDYERNLKDLRKSRRTRRWFLKLMRARPFALNHYRQETTP
jgi:hypothetical protein